MCTNLTNALNTNGILESKECIHVMYPNHPQLAHRKSCSTVLLKKVKIKKGYVLRPKMIYPYQSLKSSSGLLLNRDLLKAVKIGEVEQYLVVICVTFTTAPYGENLTHQKKTFLHLLIATF